MEGMGVIAQLTRFGGLIVKKKATNERCCQALNRTFSLIVVWLRMLALELCINVPNNFLDASTK